MRAAHLTLVGVLLCGACFLGLTRGLWTPDEPREAGIGREMLLEPGMIPTLNGTPFMEKPPLYYWLTAAAHRVAGGPRVAAARSVSALAAILTLAVVFLWISRARSVETAAVATVFLGTFTAFMTSAHWVRIDIVLMLWCATAVWAAWERIGRGATAGFLVLFYAALVLALWTKGLIGLVLIGVGLVTYAGLQRRVAVLWPLRPALGVIVLIASVGALAAAIAKDGGYDAVRTWLYVNHVQRFVHPVSTGHEAPFLYYVWTLPLAAAPWIVPLLALLHLKAPLWRRERNDAALVRFAAAMVVGPLVVLSLSSSKRQVYLLPLLPPLAFLMASSTLDRAQEATSGLWSRLGDWVQATILTSIALAPAVAEIAIARRVTASSLALLVLGTVAAGWLAAAVVRRDHLRAFWTGAACVGIALLGAVTLVVPRVDAAKDFEPFVRVVDAALPEGVPVHAIGSDQTVLGVFPFYTGRRVIPIEAGQLDGVAFVLVQSSGPELEIDALKGSYERIASREFGPRRRMSLWKRLPTRDAKRP